MSAAPFTPRVRILTVCDEAEPSEIENAVFTLVGVRQYLFPESFPCHRELCVFLLLTSTRPGSYRGWIRVIQNETDKAMRFVKFLAEFPDDVNWLSVVVNIENCRFPEIGEYTFEVWFRSLAGDDAQKGELPFYVLEGEVEP